MSSCLAIEGLTVRYPADLGDERGVAVVNEVSLRIDSGECLGIVGESGSGKTQVFLAAMGLLDRRARVAGSVRFKAHDLLTLDEVEFNRLRGAQLAMVFQDPMTSLTPHLRIGAQLREVLAVHAPELNGAAADDRAIAMLERVRIPDPVRRMRQYSHELSGGMRQRVLIAMACLCGPALLIADEPTTALDTSVQAEVLALLRELRQNTGMAVALITHDLALLAGTADRIIVMYAGRIVEAAAAPDLFMRPLHPYSVGLLQCVPRWSAARARHLPSIPGLPPDPRNPTAGCAFAPRCPRAQPLCGVERPALRLRGDARKIACHFPHDDT